MRYAAALLACLAVSGARADGSVLHDTRKHLSAALPALPGVRGHDEIRTSTGASCRNAVGGDGAFLDLGVIASDNGRRDGALGNAGVYGRVVVPLGRRPERIDCSSLYALELERMRAELKAARMAIGLGKGGDWVKEGWSGN